MKTIFKTILVLIMLTILMVSCVIQVVQASTYTLSPQQEARIRGQICEVEKGIASQRMLWRQDYDMPLKQMQGLDKTPQQRQITNYAYTFDIGETMQQKLSIIEEFKGDVYNWCMTRK